VDPFAVTTRSNSYGRLGSPKCMLALQPFRISSGRCTHPTSATGEITGDLSLTGDRRIEGRHVVDGERRSPVAPFDHSNRAGLFDGSRRPERLLLLARIRRTDSTGGRYLPRVRAPGRTGPLDDRSTSPQGGGRGGSARHSRRSLGGRYRRTHGSPTIHRSRVRR